MNPDFPPSPFSIPVRPELEEMVPYEAGKPEEEIQREYNLDEPPIKLASNENPFAPPESLRGAFEANFERLNRYPDGGCYALKQALAEKHDWPPEGIMVGAGSDEVLDFLAKALLRPGDESLTGDPAFARYPMNARMMGARPVKVPLTQEFEFDLDAMARRIGEDTRFVCIPNPNNPTSRYIPEGPLRTFLQRVPDHALIILDEAYYELMDPPDFPDGVALFKQWQKQRSNMVVLRTFSKAYGLAGLRVGYGLMAPDLARELDKIRPPFNVSRPAQNTAREVLRLDLDEYLQRCRRRIAEQRRRLVEALSQRGCRVIPPSANFMLVKFPPRVDAMDLCEELMSRGIITRPLGPYGLENFVRLTVGTPRENGRFLQELDDIGVL